MQVFLGRFHPDLEEILALEVSTRKAHEPLAPLLIVLPSETLARRVKVLLAEEKKLSLMNLHILTFHQLSLRLADETGAKKTDFQDAAFFEEALRELIRNRAPGTEPFGIVRERAGGCAALWQTLRDLKDGMVDPARAADAINEGFFGFGGTKRLSELCTLYAAIVSFAETHDLRDYSDLDRLMIPHVRHSSFLQQFQRVFYYGFYDLTQIQIEFLHEVSCHYPTSVLYPLVADDPQWSFARGFYERHLQGAVDSTRVIGGGDAAPRLPRCVTTSCSGARDELASAAKEILRLVTEEGYAFHEVGVVARTLEHYRPWIAEVFGEHGIPFYTSAEAPLIESPLAKAARILLNLRPLDYRRLELVDLATSPYFKLRPPAAARIRTDRWDLLTQRLGITRGPEEWRRLKKRLDRGLIVAEAEADDDGFNLIEIPPNEMRALWKIFAALHADLATLPDEASWAEYTRRWRLLFNKYLGIGEPPADPRSTEERVAAKLHSIFNALEKLAAVTARASLDCFIEAALRWLDRATLPLSDQPVKGVLILDAMTARGVSFRALFLLGLNEGIFPRAVREDAFLRDRHRRVFETILGYKVSEKLAGFDEEKLLFSLLTGSAAERLYCFYQRSDENGRALIPSWYLAELARRFESAGTEIHTLHVPRGVAAKRRHDPFNRADLLPPDELAVELALEGGDPAPAVALSPTTARLYRRGLRMLAAIEDGHRPLSAHDGVTRELKPHWRRFASEGVSPTALELYALCPFRYFAANVLKIDPLVAPEERGGIEPAELGRLCHQVLCSFFAEISRRSRAEGTAPGIEFMSLFPAVAARAFKAYEEDHAVSYAVVWEVLQERLAALLYEVAEAELAELARTGHSPIGFEVKISAPYPYAVGGKPERLRVTGRLDRIDKKIGGDSLRVIDYKFKTTAGPAAVDKDLALAALQAKRLQLPFYLLLLKSAAQERGQADAEVAGAFHFVAPNWPEGPLVASPTLDERVWRGPEGDRLKTTVSLLLAGVRTGKFFIIPGHYCNHCRVAQVCRKDHHPTLWRAENDRLAAPYLELRKTMAMPRRRSQENFQEAMNDDELV
jgi:ATP-dependent helicase/nuclease subunit B